MRLVILESPFAGNIERNVAYARRAISDSLKRGEAPIASHLLYTQPGILNDNIEAERKRGIEAGLAWIDRADAMVVYCDYEISSGMNSAINVALLSGLLIEKRMIGKNG